MCSELTPRAHVPDNRIPQLMQPWHPGASRKEESLTQLQKCECKAGRASRTKGHHKWKDAFISFQIHTFFALGFGFTEEEKEKEGNWKQAASHSLTWLSLSSSPTICLCTVHLTLHCIRKWTFKCKWIHVSWRTSQIFFRGNHLLSWFQRPNLVFRLERTKLTMWIEQWIRYQPSQGPDWD